MVASNLIIAQEVNDSALAPLHCHGLELHIGTPVHVDPVDQVGLAGPFQPSHALLVEQILHQPETQSGLQRGGAPVDEVFTSVAQ